MLLDRAGVGAGPAIVGDFNELPRAGAHAALAAAGWLDAWAAADGDAGPGRRTGRPATAWTAADAAPRLRLRAAGFGGRGGDGARRRRLDQFASARPTTCRWWPTVRLPEAGRTGQ